MHRLYTAVDKPAQHSFCDCYIKDDPEVPLTEDDYRRRRPHPNFREHTSSEKLVLKLGKTVIMNPEPCVHHKFSGVQK